MEDEGGGRQHHLVVEYDPRSSPALVMAFVAFGVTRNVKGDQKLQSGWLTHLEDQQIC